MRCLLPAVLFISSFLASGQNSENWEVVYLNDFSEKDSNWFTTEVTNNVSRIAVSNSRLVLELFDHGTNRAIDYTKIDFNKDFILKAEIGSKGDAKLNKKERSDFGLYFGYSAHRYHSKQGMYAYLLNFYQKGIHLFGQGEGGTKSFKTIIRNVKYNPRSYTNIGVKKEGNTVTFYLNGELIYTDKAVKTHGGALTFVAFRKMKAYMRKLTVYQKPADILNPQINYPSSDYPEKLKSLLNQIRFQSNSTELVASSKNAVAQLSQLLMQMEDVQIKIEVHTDDFGKPGDLQLLSQARADLLSNKLTAEGIDAARIETEGFGDLFPVTDSFFEEGREMNERVEISFIPAPKQENQAPEQN